MRAAKVGGGAYISEARGFHHCFYRLSLILAELKRERAAGFQLAAPVAHDFDTIKSKLLSAKRR